MGAKSPESHQQAPNGGSNDLKPTQPQTGSQNGGSQSADLDRGIVGEGGDDDDDDDHVPNGQGLGLTDAVTDKKKKKNKKKKRSKAKKPQLQTTPPSVLVSTLFPTGSYPAGQLVPYENTERTTSEEKRYESRKWDDSFLAEYRQGAEIHRQVRHHVQENVIKPGVKLSIIAEEIEAGVRALCGHQGLEVGDPLVAGLAFPTGLSVNHIAAHWTPNPGGADPVLGDSDVMSVDFGVHINGRIVDSAFTISTDPTHDNLLAAVKAATNTGLAHAGVDARIADISAAIQETMESYEVEINGKTRPVKAVRSLCGHDILRYQIHGGKQIPLVKTDNPDRMEEGEVFAIETFGTTGRGNLRDDAGVFGYGRQQDVSAAHVSLASAKALLKTIDANFSTLPFCRRYLERLGVKSYHLGMKHLIETGLVEMYPPLVDNKGSYVAQFEHTVLIGECGKEIISRGDDY